MNQTNQNNCDIARDLMPLSIDGVCSEGSQRFLDAHVAECKPCNDYFDGMKTGMLNIKMEPTQESKSLKKSLRHMGKRFKALWITLAALACAFALLLVAAGVNQVLMNHTEAAPLDMYTINLFRNDALVSTALSGSFYEQVYDGYQTDRYYFTLEGEDEEHVILTYTVHWFPYQHKQLASAMKTTVFPDPAPTSFKPMGVDAPLVEDGAVLAGTNGWMSDYRFTTGLDFDTLCMDNGQLYLIDGWDSVQTTTGRTLMIPKLGTPVYEVRLSDGKETRTIYAAWRNDEIPNVSADRLDKNGIPMSGILSPSDLDKYADFIVK